MRTAQAGDPPIPPSGYRLNVHSWASATPELGLNRASEHVLLIDPAPESRAAIRDILRPAGYRITEVDSGEDGLRRALQDMPHLVVAEGQLPRMGIASLVQQMRQQGLDAPVILLSGSNAKTVAIQAVRLGVRDCLSKPLQATELLAAVDRALAESRLSRERDELTHRVVEMNTQFQQVHGALKRQLQEVNALYSIGKSVTALLDLQQVLNRVVEAAVYITRAEQGSLFLPDKASGELYVRAARNIEGRMVRELRLPVRETIPGRVLHTGKPIMLAPDFQTKIKTSYLVKAAIYVPLRVKDRVIGVLSVDNQFNNRPFSPRDMQVLSALADYAAVAVENAQLVYDLTLQKQSLEQAYTELEEQDRLKDELVQNLSHELRTPLSLIKGYIELLLTGGAGEVEKQQEEILQVVTKKTDALVHFVSGIVSLQTITPDLLNLVSIRLTDLARRVLTVQAGVARDHNLTLVADWSDDLPATLMDPNRISQMLDNLINNAIKFSPDGGQITLRLRDVGPAIRIEVIDQGIGIPTDKVQRVFDRFYQVDGTATRRFPGVGLGLAICKQIIEAHGGRIWVESQLGQGSTFIALLPRRVAK